MQLNDPTRSCRIPANSCPATFYMPRSLSPSWLASRAAQEAMWAQSWLTSSTGAQLSAINSSPPQPHFHPVPLVPLALPVNSPHMATNWRVQPWHLQGALEPNSSCACAVLNLRPENISSSTACSMLPNAPPCLPPSNSRACPLLPTCSATPVQHRQQPSSLPTLVVSTCFLPASGGSPI